MASMLSLLDVLPRHEQVDIGASSKLDIFGISGMDIGEILRRYPDAFQQIADSGSQPIKMKPGLLGALLAASQRNGDSTTSFLGDEKMEGRCRSLDASSQMKMLEAIGRCTFPEGIGPFLNSLVSFSEATLKVMELVVQIASKAPDTESPPTPKPLEQPATQASGI